uniref:DUF3444 domain-containing protein n=1 Tax=Strongyloides papillosus TaxID=174720 RepID=A0A0N5BVE5_STREA
MERNVEVPLPHVQEGHFVRTGPYVGQVPMNYGDFYNVVSNFSGGCQQNRKWKRIGRVESYHKDSKLLNSNNFYLTEDDEKV